jgi:hypothetical protein
VASQPLIKVHFWTYRLMDLYSDLNYTLTLNFWIIKNITIWSGDFFIWNGWPLMILSLSSKANHPLFLQQLLSFWYVGLYLLTGASVADWLRSLASNLLPLTSVGSYRASVFGLFLWECYPASTRNIGGSTWVATCAIKNVQRGIECLPSLVKLESRHMTSNMVLRR